MWRFGLWNSFLFIESCEMSQRGGWKTFAKLPGKDRVVKCKLEVKTSRIMLALHFQDYSFKKHGQEKLKELWRWKPRTLGGKYTANQNCRILEVKNIEQWNTALAFCKGCAEDSSAMSFKLVSEVFLCLKYRLKAHGHWS